MKQTPPARPPVPVVEVQEQEDDSIGFARTRPKTAPPKLEPAVEVLLTPQDSLTDHSIFSHEEQQEAGFARSGEYAK